MKRMEVHSRFEVEREPVGVWYPDPAEEVLTRQEAKDDCDINRIMKKYLKGGDLPLERREAMYGDFSNVDDYLGAQLLVERAQEQFSSLPSELRTRFKNDPAAFLDFAADPNNADELVRLKLATKRAEPMVEVPAGGVVVETLKTSPAVPPAAAPAAPPAKEAK